MTKKQKILLFTVLLATFMGIIDGSIINVAAPSIQKGMQATFQQVQLIIASYIIAYGAGLILGGRLGDTYGRKRIFTVGLIGFVAFSGLCSLAQQSNFLILARILQGSFAALMLPQVLAIIRVAFQGSMRVKALGFYGATIGFASVIAQLVGGSLLAWNLFGLGWRLVFLVNVPIGIGALILCQLYLPESKSEQPLDIDVVGSILLAFFMICLLYPLIMVVRTGWTGQFSLISGLALLLGVLFLTWEKRMEAAAREPLLRLGLFKFPQYRLGVLTVLTFYGANIGFYLVLAYFFQSGQHLSPFASGIGYMPLGIGFALGALVSKGLIEKYADRVLVSAMTLKMIGLVLLSADVFYGFSTVQFAPALFCIGLGEGVVAVSLIGKVLLGLQSELAGLASGSLLTATQLANVLGVTVTGGLYTYFISNYGLSYQVAFNRALIWICILVFLTSLLLYSLDMLEKSPKKEPA